MTYNITFTKATTPCKMFPPPQADINKRINSAIIQGLKVVQIDNSLIIDYHTTQAIITKSIKENIDYSYYLLKYIAIALSIILIIVMIKIVLFGY